MKIKTTFGLGGALALFFFNTAFFSPLLWNEGAKAYSQGITLSPSSLPNATVFQFYNQTITPSGGMAPFTFAVTNGFLPGGLGLNSSTGVISGSPMSTFSTPPFTITATDFTGATGSNTYTITVLAASNITLNPISLLGGTVGQTYNRTITASGGTGPYTYSIINGSLPAGLLLNFNTGTISGTPGMSGSFAFTISATDFTGALGSRAYTLSIAAAPIVTLSPATLPDGAVNQPYNQTVAGNGGAFPYSFSVISGSLPTNLSLNGSNGQITGTPVFTGSSSFTIRATDATGISGTQAYSISITPTPLWMPGSGQFSVLNNLGGGNSTFAPYSLLAAGTNNSIAPNAWYGNILGGSGNQLQNAIGAIPQYNLIGNGSNNIIPTSGLYTVLLNGSSNLASGKYAALLSGTSNQANSDYSFIGTGQNNIIHPNAQYGVILSGTNNIIENAAFGGPPPPASDENKYNFISNGTNNTIQHLAHHSSIIGGSGNTIGTGAANSVMLGGSNRTATLSDAVYLPKIVFPDNTIQTTAGVQQNSSVIFSTLQVSNLTGVGDRTLGVDPSGNLKVMIPLVSVESWDRTGNGVAQGNFAPGDFLGTLDANDLVLKANANTPAPEDRSITITATGDHPGNVGIGTAVPEKKLHIVTKHSICSTCSPLSHEGIRLEEQTTFTDFPAMSPLPNVWDLQPFGGGFAIKKSTGVPKLMITNAGNVGIGTSNPLTALQVHGSVSVFDPTAAPGMGDISLFFGQANTVNSSRGKWAIQYVKSGSLGPQGGLNFWIPALPGNNFGNNYLFLADNGKVGIRTSNPQADLDVNGNAAIASTLRIGPQAATAPFANYRLSVDGSIVAKEVHVNLTTWADNVFGSQYKLPIPSGN